jgi:hypothetical protein
MMMRLALQMAVGGDKQTQVRRSRRHLAVAKGREDLPHDGLLGFLATCDGGSRPTEHLQHAWQERETQLMGYVNTLQRKLDTALNEVSTSVSAALTAAPVVCSTPGSHHQGEHRADGRAHTPSLAVPCPIPVGRPPAPLLSARQYSHPSVPSQIELLKTERTTLEQRLNSANYQPRKIARPAAAPSSPKPPKYPRPALRSSATTHRAAAALAAAPHDGGWAALGEYLTSIDTLPTTTTPQQHQHQPQPQQAPESPSAHPPASPCAQQRVMSPLYDWTVALGSPQLDPLSFQFQMDPVEEGGSSATSSLRDIGEVDIFSLFAHERPGRRLAFGLASEP